MLRFLLPVVLFLFPLSANAELRLLMFEQDGCYWCEQWNKEIGPIYPKTQEGRAAPLERVDIWENYPADITIKSRPSFTPTFVLLDNDVEIFRIPGYPGEDFFWVYLEQAMKTLPEYKAAEAGS